MDTKLVPASRTGERTIQGFRHTFEYKATYDLIKAPQSALAQVPAIAVYERFESVTISKGGKVNESCTTTTGILVVQLVHLTAQF